MNKQIGIIGFGRFGQLLANLLKPDFTVRIVESDGEKQTTAKKQGFEIVSLAALKDADTIWLAVPISEIESVLKRLAPIISKSQTVMDVCSVKVYPARLMRQYLTNCQTIATHPVFGPDSTKQGLDGLKMALCPLAADKQTVQFWQDFWKGKGIEVIQTAPEKHDRDMIYSLAFTQTLARLVGQMEIPDLLLTTRNFEAVKTVTDLSLNDTDQLYYDMLRYNPYFPEMKAGFLKAANETLKQLDEIAGEQR